MESKRNEKLDACSDRLGSSVDKNANVALLAKAIELNPQYAKAYYRRGLCYLAILRPTEAVPDFKKALGIDPGNKSIREQLQMTVKLIRRIEFEKVHHFNPVMVDADEVWRRYRSARLRPPHSNAWISSHQADAGWTLQVNRTTCHFPS